MKVMRESQIYFGTHCLIMAETKWTHVPLSRSLLFSSISDFWQSQYVSRKSFKWQKTYIPIFEDFCNLNLVVFKLSLLIPAENITKQEKLLNWNIILRQNTTPKIYRLHLIFLSVTAVIWLIFPIENNL